MCSKLPKINQAKVMKRVDYEMFNTANDLKYVENTDNILDNVFVDGEKVEGATIVTKQFVPMGPGASQIAIKQLGTNGGGFFGVNSAHPLENPNSLTNMIECTALLLIPAGLCFKIWFLNWLSGSKLSN